MVWHKKRKSIFAVLLSFLLLFSYSMNFSAKLASAATLEPAVMVTILGLDAEETVLQTTAVSFEEGDTAFDVLIYMDEKGTIDFDYAVDDVLGAYIKSFNGIAPKETEFWNFAVNGASANVGISGYQLKHGDHLLFVLTDWRIFPPEVVNSKVSIIGPDGEDIVPETDVSLVPGSTAYDALKQVAHQYGITLQASIDSEWLVFVEDINDLLPENEYWSTYINDEYMQVGLAGYSMEEGDHLKLEAPLLEKPGNEPSNPPQDEGKDSEDQGHGPVPISEDKLKEVLQGTASYLNSTNTLDWYGLIAYKAMKLDVPEKMMNDAIETVVQAEGEFRSITELEKQILILTAAGYNATDVQGYNLIEKLANHPRMENQGLNGPIYALLALDSAKYEIPNDAKWTRDKLVQLIVDAQLPNGGWALFGDAASPDLTGMALAALAPYKIDEKVDSAITKAVNWLSEIQTESGGFYVEWNGGEASESVSQVIIGLTALNIDPAGRSFTKSGGNLLTKLLSYKTEDGGFKHLENDREDNVFSTNQALLALAAYQNYLQGKGSVFQFAFESDLEPVENVKAPDDGKTLPATAGNDYKLLFAGIVLVVLTFGYMSLQRVRLKRNDA